LQQSLGWSRGEIAFALTLATLFTPLVAPLTGWVVDKVPLRPLILVGVVLQSLNFAAFSMMEGSVWVYYGLCLALMVTAAGASLLTLAKLVQGWFDRSLGRALGLLFACGGVGGILHPLWTQAVITQFGWRQAFMVMAGLSLLMWRRSCSCANATRRRAGMHPPRRVLDHPPQRRRRPRPTAPGRWPPSCATPSGGSWPCSTCCSPWALGPSSCTSRRCCRTGAPPLDRLLSP
jgi:MFS family permease